jgi:hypothetical protein
MARAFDAALILQHDLETINHQRLPIELQIDSLAVFKTFTQGTTTLERRLALDVAVN